MWPFFSKNKTPEYATPVRRELKFHELLEKMGDISDLKSNDVAFKFWLPLPVFEALQEICDIDTVSQSEFFRNYLFNHCYGLYVIKQVVDMYPYIFKDHTPRYSVAQEPTPPGKKKSWTYWVPELGKNIVPIKIWIPKRLRDDLQTLADHAEVKISQYVREIIISRLLGHGMVPLRPEMFKAIATPEADQWCTSEEFAWREVAEQDYKNAIERRADFEWIDETSTIS
jgi:hypothetical protein